MLGLGLGTDDYISDFTMAGNAVFPGILTIISLGFAVLSIYNAESRDLIQYTEQLKIAQAEEQWIPEDIHIIEIYNGDKKSFYTKEILERLTICTDT